MLATLGEQISLADSDARSIAKGGRGSGIVGYNVQMSGFLPWGAPEPSG